MENHSYDHMLGWLPKPIGDLTGQEVNYINPLDKSSLPYYVNMGADYFTRPDPAHLFPATNR